MTGHDKPELPRAIHAARLGLPALALPPIPTQLLGRPGGAGGDVRWTAALILLSVANVNALLLLARHINAQHRAITMLAWHITLKDARSDLG